MPTTSKLEPSTVRAAEQTVLQVKVVVHNAGQTGPNTSENHWSIYLILSGTASVRVNMRAEYGDPTGILEWSSCPYVKSASQFEAWTFDCEKGTKIKDVANMIYEWRRDKYEMSGGGSGCRFWVYTVLSDMGRKKLLVEKNAFEKLWTPLQYRYHVTNAPVQINWVEGQFTA